MTKAKRKGGPGRNKAADPKRVVQFYCEQSIIDAVGGIEAARKFGYNALCDLKIKLSEKINS